MTETTLVEWEQKLVAIKNGVADLSGIAAFAARAGDLPAATAFVAFMEWGIVA